MPNRSLSVQLSAFKYSSNEWLAFVKIGNIKMSALLSSLFVKQWFAYSIEESKKPSAMFNKFTMWSCFSILQLRKAILSISIFLENIGFIKVTHNVEHVYVVLAFEILMLHKLVDDD